MVSRVTYRPFEDDDFDAVASILRELWHDDGPTEEYCALEAACDLAHSLSISTFSQVVLADDTPRGVILARVAGTSSPRAAHWARLERSYLTQLWKADAAAAQAYQDTMATMQRIDEQLRDESGMVEASEITLLAVGAGAQGMGIGSVLLDAASAHAAARGSRGIYLYTDTDCTWKFYERHGLKRAAAYRSTWEERRTLPKEMYLYGLDLSA